MRLLHLGCFVLLVCCAEQHPVAKADLNSLAAAIPVVVPKLILEPPLGTVPHASLQTTEGYSDHSWSPSNESIFEYLRPVLKNSRKVARLSYRASCQNADFPHAVPRVLMERPPPGVIGLSAVKAIFQNDSNVVVTEEQDGIIRVRIGEVNDAILQTRISRVTFRGLSQYDGSESLDTLQWTPEMVATRQRLGIGMPPVHIIDMLGRIQPGWVHLPSEVSNATADQVLDQIARTFGGIVMYVACENSSEFNLYFVNG